MARTEAGQIRIIGGRLRGRRLAVAHAPGLRPTGARARETLFNWLQPALPGSRCLDAFAGSGALGFEALSRGAAHVLLVEREPALARRLREQATLFGLDNAEILCRDSLPWLDQAQPRPFDIVFLDPPFAAGLLASVCARLAARGWVRPGARVYLESPVDQASPSLPKDWEWLREKRAGAVRFALATVAAGPTAAAAPP